jgi:xylitol oxidase
MQMDLVNWAGNYMYRAKALREPSSMDELRRIVARSRSLRPVGTRHSFTDIGDAAELVSLSSLPGKVAVDRDTMTVTVPAGLTYGALAKRLMDNGLALHAMASLPHISVGGAVQTGTHGSGDRSGSLATAVRGIEMVTSEGDILTVFREDEGFAGMVVGLGALGVVTSLTLDVEPAYRMTQRVYRHLAWETFAANLDAITSAAASVSLFTTWGDDIDQVWLKSRIDESAEPQEEDPDAPFFGAVPATHPMHPVPDQPADACTAQLGVPGSWADRLPHFRMDATPSSGEEIQSEYVIDRAHLEPAVEALRRLAPAMRPHLFVAEIRTIADDDQWLSMAHERESAAIHFTWHRDHDAVFRLLPTIEEALAPFAPRPHWGKTFVTRAADLAERYPRMDDFRALQQELDYRGAFRNAWLDRVLYG